MIISAQEAAKRVKYTDTSIMEKISKSVIEAAERGEISARFMLGGLGLSPARSENILNKLKNLGYSLRTDSDGYIHLGWKDHLDSLPD